MKVAFLRVTAVIGLITIALTTWQQAGQLSAAMVSAPTKLESPETFLRQNNIEPDRSTAWREISAYEAVAGRQSERDLPHSFRAWEVDVEQLVNALASGHAIDLPVGDEQVASFLIEPTQTMAPKLAAAYPQMLTFRGRVADQPDISVRLESTSIGITALLTTPQSDYIIEPLADAGRPHVYLSYAADSSMVDQLPLVDDVIYSHADDVHQLYTAESEREANDGGLRSSGDELRVYRLAVATTGEFTQAHGGTLENSLAAVVSRINQLNGIFERDVAIRFELVADNDALIFTDGQTDPFTDGDLEKLIEENQQVVDQLIGSANYDVAHLFAADAQGGLAHDSAACTEDKAKGVSGTLAPIYMIGHELGHQFSADHTFNGTAGICGNHRNSFSAFEPGAGSTMMSYGSSCGTDNVGPRQNYFHVHSYDQIRDFVTLGDGATCGAPVAQSNIAPTVDAGSTQFAIPANTPFVLHGSGSDVDSDDELRYIWEQYDLGPASSAAEPIGNAPMFRSQMPVSEPTRIFPQLGALLNDDEQPPLGERLPTYSRSISFRLRALDQNGGVSYDQMQLDVVDTGRPFAILSPDSSTERWLPNTTQTILWDVAGTDLAPISCEQVNIDLSLDGGYTFSHSLAEGVANDGEQEVVVPAVHTGKARVRVLCAALPDHGFFDISTSFVIQIAQAGDCVEDRGVSSLADNGSCSLRSAIENANAGDIIVFDQRIANGVIYLDSPLKISKDITIMGGENSIILSGNGRVPVFSVSPSVNVYLSNLTISDGYSPAEDVAGGLNMMPGSHVTLKQVNVIDNVGGQGGGIFQYGGHLVMISSTVANNIGSGGGGLYKAFGSTLIYNSTISNNTANWWGGGGISNRWGGSLVLVNSTVADNDGGGVNGEADLHLVNSVIANSTLQSDCAAGDIFSSVNSIVADQSCGTDIVGDPMLAPLDDNGGDSLTHALEFGSAAIDAGDMTVCAISDINFLDQRMFARDDHQCDIGAYEYGASSVDPFFAWVPIVSTR